MSQKVHQAFIDLRSAMENASKAVDEQERKFDERSTLAFYLLERTESLLSDHKFWMRMTEDKLLEAERLLLDIRDFIGH